MLEQDIRDIRENLRRECYPNEAAVSQGIVLRLLHTLGWPIHEAQVVHPQYPVEDLYVDYALCHPASKPRIFIEVKGVGKSNKAERQLFEYAFRHLRQDILLAVLTDGREWSFFLPAAGGSYEERQAYKLNLVENDIAESARGFERYLSHKAVRSGAAFTAAQDDYQDIARKRQTNDPDQKAWARLVPDQNEYLLEVIADCVELLYGYKPSTDKVARSLQEMRDQTGARSPRTPARPSTPSEPPPAPGETGATDVTFPQPLDLGSASIGLPRPLMQPSQDSGPGLSSE